MTLPERALSSEEAVEAACEHLKTLGLADEIATRVATVRQKGRGFQVSFKSIPGTRSGDFIVTVGQEGNILEQKFHR